MARREAREAAMRLLYQNELGGEGVDSTIQGLMEVNLDGDDRAYVQNILDGVSQRREQLDETIHQYAIGWSLDRMAKVDLSILRLALYEMLFREDVPDGAAINEAVELTHTYSTPEAGAFVNGILGSVSRAGEDKP